MGVCSELVKRLKTLKRVESGMWRVESEKNAINPQVPKIYKFPEFPQLTITSSSSSRAVAFRAN